MSGDSVEIFKEYFVFKEGYVFSRKTNKKMYGSPDKDGYLRVGLTLNGKLKTFKVHRLVLMAYSPVENMDTLQVNHKNGIKSDNRLENLEWATAQENVKHSFDTGLKKQKGGSESKLSHLTKDDILNIASLYSENKGALEISKNLNLNYNSVIQMLRGKRYAEDFKKAMTEDLLEKRNRIIKQLEDRKNGDVPQEVKEKIYWDRFFYGKNGITIAKETKIKYPAVMEIIKGCPRYHESKTKRRLMGPGPRSGEKNGRSKLSESDVLDIFKRVKETPISYLAKEYSISRTVIKNIESGKFWSHVTGKQYNGN